MKSIAVIFGTIGIMMSSFFGKTDGKRITLVSPVAIVTPTIEITLTPPATPSATPTKLLTPKPKKIVPSPTPTPETGEIVNKLIDKYSAEYGLDPNVMRHMVLCESGARSNAKNGIYVGLFQYDERTWTRIRSEMGLPTDIKLRYSAEEMIKTTCYAISKGRSKLWPNCVP